MLRAGSVHLHSRRHRDSWLTAEVASAPTKLSGECHTDPTLFLSLRLGVAEAGLHTVVGASFVEPEGVWNGPGGGAIRVCDWKRGCWMQAGRRTRALMLRVRLSLSDEEPCMKEH